MTTSGTLEQGRASFAQRSWGEAYARLAAEQCLKPVDEQDRREGSYPPDHPEGPQARPARQRRSGRYDPMLTVVPEAADADDPRGDSSGSSLIDEIVRDGARRMLAEALQAEVDAYIAQFVGERDERGRRLVVRNGSHQPREVLTSAGAVGVTAPRVNDRRVDPDTGQRARFASAILPAWCRKTPKITEVLPLLYLHGLSTGDFVPALGQFLGSSAGSVRVGDHQADRDLEGRAAHVLGSGSVRCGLRLSVGRRHPRQHPAGGAQAVPAGHDRGPRRWPQGARRAHRRLPGVHRVLGGPAARLRPAWDARPGPRGRGRRARVLGRAARGVPAGQRATLLVPQDREHAWSAAQVGPSGGEEGARGDLERRGPPTRTRRGEVFEAAYGAKFPKAVAKITDDVEELLAFYDYPAEHWIHLRTTNPIESTFATVRHRTKITRGPGSRAAGLAMAFKLIEAAQDRWRAVNAPHLVALVRAGASSRPASSSNDPTNTLNPKPPKRSSSTGLDYCSWRRRTRTRRLSLTTSNVSRSPPT